MTNKHKDNSPQNTVERIKKIFAEIGVEMQGDISRPVNGIYSMVLSDIEHGWSVNGKGTTPDYCLASAYGEAIERLQAHWVYGPVPLSYETKFHAYEYFPNTMTKDVDDIPKLLPDLFRSLQNMWQEDSFDSKNLLDFWKKILGGKQTLFAPYYAIKRASDTLLPECLITTLCGSNGLCAGNTQEEAICQGMAEVFERYATLEIVKKGLTPPEISREYIKENYPNEYKMIEEIEALGEYHLRVVDASLGKKCPALAVVLINRKRQSYLISFGAHPKFAIALERCLTELCQGYRPGSDHMDQAFMTKWHNMNNYYPYDSTANIYALMRVKIASVSDDFFAGEPSWNFIPWDSQDVDNASFVRTMTKTLLSIAPEVYIKDHSFLGFPTYRVYVPGVSEIAKEQMNKNWFAGNELYRELISLKLRSEPIDEDLRRKLINFIEDPNNHFALMAKYTKALPVRLEAIHAALLNDAGEFEHAAHILESLADFDKKYGAAADELRMKKYSVEKRDTLLECFYGEINALYAAMVWRTGSAVQNILSPLFTPTQNSNDVNQDKLTSLYKRIAAHIKDKKLDQEQLRKLFIDI